jgi:hypothetical protein
MDRRWWKQDAQQQEGEGRIERFTRFRGRWPARGSLLSASSASSSPITPTLAPSAAASRVERKQVRGAWVGSWVWLDGWRRLPLSTAHIGTALLRMNE